MALQYQLKQNLKARQLKEVIDKYHESNQNSFNSFGISFDNYSRTSLKFITKLHPVFLRNWNLKTYLN